MNTNKVLVWLKDFKYTWLSENIFNDSHLIELISNKLHELEQLLIGKYPTSLKKKPNKLSFLVL